MTKADTTKPHVLSANMTDRYHILLEISEYLDSTKVGANNFTVFDSTDEKAHNVKYMFNDPNKKKQKFLVITDSINQENNIFLISENLVDKSGNITGLEITSIAVSNRADTTAPMVQSIKSADGLKKVDFKKPAFTCRFNDAFDYQPTDTSIRIIGPNDQLVEYQYEKRDDATLVLQTLEDLNSNSKYEIKIDLNAFTDAAGNSMDSVYSYTFDTINELNFSGALGSVKTDTVKKPHIVMLQNLENKEVKYSQKLFPGNMDFQFNRVQPGNYQLWVFEDTDSSGNYSHGNIYPYHHSEKFVYYPDTLNLRARWPVGDILINFD
jgi:hypothetical protein